MLGSRRSDKPNPVGRKLQELEETSHQLAERMAELEEQLRANNQPLPPGFDSREAAIWRGDPDEPNPAGADDPMNRRGLRRQQARDRNLFIVLFFVLAIVLVWLYQKIAAGS